MARGTANGEPIVSQAQNRAFDEGYDRTFGTERGERGRFVWDEAQKKLVRAEDYVPLERAVNAPILSGRFYENTKATDGTDIGSRSKHRRYMSERGLTSSSDFSPRYYEGIKRERERAAKASRRETIARKLYEITKP